MHSIICQNLKTPSLIIKLCCEKCSYMVFRHIKIHFNSRIHQQCKVYRIQFVIITLLQKLQSTWHLRPYHEVCIIYFYYQVNFLQVEHIPSGKRQASLSPLLSFNKVIESPPHASFKCDCRRECHKHFITARYYIHENEDLDEVAFLGNESIHLNDASHQTSSFIPSRCFPFHRDNINHVELDEISCNLR